MPIIRLNLHSNKEDLYKFRMKNTEIDLFDIDKNPVFNSYENVIDFKEL